MWNSSSESGSQEFRVTPRGNLLTAEQFRVTPLLVSLPGELVIDDPEAVQQEGIDAEPRPSLGQEDAEITDLHIGEGHFRVASAPSRM